MRGKFWQHLFSARFKATVVLKTHWIVIVVSASNNNNSVALSTRYRLHSFANADAFWIIAQIIWEFYKNLYNLRVYIIVQFRQCCYYATSCKATLLANAWNAINYRIPSKYLCIRTLSIVEINSLFWDWVCVAYWNWSLFNIKGFLSNSSWFHAYMRLNVESIMVQVKG